jgi:APA family basic amino acid/polyamine antiporter
MNWHGFATVNARGTPTRALLASTVVAILLIVAAEGLFDWLLAVTTFLYAVVYLSGFASMWRLRATEPGMVRPYRAFGHPWSTGFVMVVSLAFLAGLLYSDTANSIWSVGLLAACVPLWWTLRRLRG